MPLFRAPIDARYRWGIVLAGAKDGINLVYTTPEFFVQDGNVVIRVYLNGQELAIADDYSVSESGGPGTGFDTVTLIAPVSPLSWEHLAADYTAE